MSLLNLRTIAPLAAAALLAPAAFAQNTYQAGAFTIDGGGTTRVAAGVYEIGLTLGQPDAAAPVASGTYQLAGGFWPGVGVCRPDINGDGQVNVADFLAFLALYSAGDLRADFTGNGSVAVDDFLAFLAAYSAGC
jgi:hypothetical protein